MGAGRRSDRVICVIRGIRTRSRGVIVVDVRRSFTVACPLDRVVAYLADFSRAKEWDPGTQECDRTDGPAGAPVVQGATWHNVSEFRGVVRS